MAWSVPRTWVTSELVTAGLMNTHVRDEFRATGEGDWTTLILAFMTPFSNTNWTTLVSSGTLGRRDSSGVQNDEIVYRVPLVDGTWTVDLWYTKGTDSGIFSVQFDGVEKGTVDAYEAGGGTNDNNTAITGIAVTNAGAKTDVKLKMATKNASSSSYFGRFHSIFFTRTA